MATAPAPVTSFSGEHRWLSNFWPCEFTWRGLQWHNIETAYQAEKCSFCSDYARIHGASTPGLAKKLGRNVAMKPDWGQIKVPTMRALLQIKFAAGTQLAGQLLRTGDAELIEGNTWGDRFWGKCNGVGENQLGRLLMEQRAALQQLATKVGATPQ